MKRKIIRDFHKSDYLFTVIRTLYEVKLVVKSKIKFYL
jgi:hypothetical protein